MSRKSPPFLRPLWAEIDLAHLSENLRRLRNLIPSKSKLLFVVKANAYGHGALKIAKTAESSRLNGRPLVDWFGVSSVEEGVFLRQAGIKIPILILGSLYPFESFLEAAHFGLIPTIASLEAARKLSEAGLEIHSRLDAHLKIDTGMGRIGVSPQSAPQVANYLRAQKGAALRGVYTHLASADNDPDFTRFQISGFKRALSAMGLKNGKILRHAANSAAILNDRKTSFDMVRAGLALYGLCPGFEPVLSLKARIVFIKKVRKGVPISYGGTFRARRSSVIATVCAGYGDGILRAQSNRGKVLIEGKKADMIGAITMDMLMVDVTDIPKAHVGSEVVFIGRQGSLQISAKDAALAAKTIPYEITCMVSQRVPRIYLPA